MYKTVYQKYDNSYFPSVENPPNYYHEIPVGTYVVGYDMKMGYFVQECEDFRLPPKVYGSVHGRAERIINTFFSRPNSTGVILSGEKGSGKTLLAKKLGIDLQKKGVITLIVNQPHCGDDFNMFIQSIKQPAYILFDEYEKVYNKEEYQNALLTLFDGVFPSKKLFAVTSNERQKMNSYMINRPGRFFYAFEYKGMEESDIREYLEDNLDNKNHLESFVRYTSTYDAFNFDMLHSLCEEMNRYKETVTEAAKFVNVSQSWTSRFEYDVIKLVWKGEVPEGYVKFQKEANSGNSFNPIIHNMYIYYDVKVEDDKGEYYDDTEQVSFQPVHIKNFGNNKYVYENEQAIVEIEKKFVKSFDINNLL